MAKKAARWVSFNCVDTALDDGRLFVVGSERVPEQFAPADAEASGRVREPVELIGAPAALSPDFQKTLL